MKKNLAVNILKFQRLTNALVIAYNPPNGKLRGWLIDKIIHIKILSDKRKSERRARN